MKRRARLLPLPGARATLPRVEGAAGTGDRRRVGQFTALTVAAAVALSGCAGVSATPAASQGATGHDTAGSTHARPKGILSQTPLDPSFFARGSCVALPPTHGNRHETVFLDAGHGGVDPGAVGTTQSGVTVYEKNLTLAVELDAAAILRADGYRTVVSRTTAGPVAKPKPGAIVGGLYTTAGARAEVAARDICANLARAKVLVGIYFDAGASPLNAGCVTGYDAVRRFAASNLRLATLLQRDVLTAMNNRGWQIPDEGVLSDVSLGSGDSARAIAYGHLLLLGPAKSGYFSTPSEMPGALIEPLFLTDPFEATIADTAVGQRVIAGGIAKAVEAFLR